MTTRDTIFVRTWGYSQLATITEADYALHCWCFASFCYV